MNLDEAIQKHLRQRAPRVVQRQMWQGEPSVVSLDADTDYSQPRKSGIPGGRHTTPTKRQTKGRGKPLAHDPFADGRVGVGSNTVRGCRAVAGDIRAIAAAKTNCHVATTAEERRLRAAMRATTDRAETGMQYVWRSR